MSPQNTLVDLYIQLFKTVLRRALMIAADAPEGETRSKVEILQFIKTNFWEMFNSISSEEKIDDIFAGDCNPELSVLLRVDYPYKNDEDAEELLNVWAYTQAKALF